MKTQITCQDVLDKFKKYSKKDISSRTRTRSVADERFAYYYLCSKYTNEDDTGIGFSLISESNTKGFDRCSVIHGVKEFKNIIGKDFYRSNDIFIIINRELADEYNELNANRKQFQLDIDQDTEMSSFYKLKYGKRIKNYKNTIISLRESNRQLKKRLELIA